MKRTPYTDSVKAVYACTALTLLSATVCFDGLKRLDVMAAKDALPTYTEDKRNYHKETRVAELEVSIGRSGAVFFGLGAIVTGAYARSLKRRQSREDEAREALVSV